VKSLLAIAPGPIVAWVVSFTNVFQGSFFAPVEYLGTADTSVAALSTILSIVVWYGFRSSPKYRLRVSAVVSVTVFILAIGVCGGIYFYLSEPRPREVVERWYVVWAFVYTFGMTMGILAIVFAILSAVGGRGRKSSTG
jgi:hypothetical protein